MKKKEYQKPEIKVVLRPSCRQLLVGSDVSGISSPDSFDYGGGGNEEPM